MHRTLPMPLGASVYNLRVSRVKKKNIGVDPWSCSHLQKIYTFFFLIIFRLAVSEFLICCVCAKSIDQKKKKKKERNYQSWTPWLVRYGAVWLVVSWSKTGNMHRLMYNWLVYNWLGQPRHHIVNRVLLLNTVVIKPTICGGSERKIHERCSAAVVYPRSGIVQLDSRWPLSVQTPSSCFQTAVDVLC